MLAVTMGELFMVLVSVPGKVAKLGFSMALGLAVAGCGGGSGDGGGLLPADVAVSGVIDIEAGTRVDADNADALLGRAPLISDQELPPEFILSGYVSGVSQPTLYPPTPGLSDDFYYFPDTEDNFVARLQPGFEITLQSFATRLAESGTDSATASELRLTITSSDGTELGPIIAPSNGSPVKLATGTEPAGEYRISVTSLGAAPMLYILSSSRAVTANTTAYDWPDYEFVEDEAVVSLRDPGNAGARASGLPASALMAPGRQIAPGLWTVHRPAPVAAMEQGNPAQQTLDWIRQLKDDPSVLHASPNYKTQALATPVNEPLYPSRVLGQQWHYSLINGPIAWQLDATGGAGVNVAVFDTGLFRNNAGQWHPDFQVNGVYNIVDGFDAVDGGVPADPGNAVGGSVYHGTHVAGTVAAAVNNKGGAGVAFGASLVPVRVLGEGGSGTLADLLQAMQWVLGDASGPRAKVVNLSLGGLPCGASGVADTLQQLINDGVEKGIVYVAAAGNSATNEPSCPAALDKVFSVSAVDGGGRLSSYSNFGSSIDLAAPGGDASRDGNGDGQGDLVSSTSAAVVDGQLQAAYRGLQGTSMAAPHVYGVVALMKGVRLKDGGPELTYAGIEGYLRSGNLTQTSCEADCSPTDQLGYGILDAGKAVEAVLSEAAPELLTASPAVVNLATESNQAVSQTLELASLGDYTISINSVAASAPWFTVSPAAGPFPDATQTAPLRLDLTLNPQNLEPGASSRGSLVVKYSPQSGPEKTLDIPVVGQRITDQQARDAGRHFVLLVDPQPEGAVFNTVAQTAVRAENGQYQFEFLPDDGQAPNRLNEVPPGKYFLVAGTDLDNDGLICHAGEACAEYPVAGLRQVIEVRENQPVTGLRMTTSYSRPTLSATSPDLLPRPDFKGYRLLPEQAGSQSTSIKAVKTP
ncbi:S8 family serine peptidase [Marinobacter subterrani]|uniref:Subtilase family n=1 Tax=Marinobacter subterrani TaxID=1658765 RepID=A0A0J7M441_9GAMM|nr:S8 family serine peptidase [Marinobacter subterrani]KMQ75745.1 Subtilase family [Marinobacter subterrani]